MKEEMSSGITDLCNSCKHCTKITGYGKEFKSCTALGEEIKFPVQNCSKYLDKLSPSLWELEQMAFHIEKKKDSPGFKIEKPKDGQFTYPRPNF